jgi:hypothetical protein
MWNTIKITQINPKSHNITSVKVTGNLSFNGQIVMDAFSKYFTLSVESNFQSNAMPSFINFKTYLCKAFTQPFPVINWKWVSPKEK